MTDKDRTYIRRFRWKFWLRWKYLRMMKRFAIEIHRDMEREKDTIMRCRKSIQTVSWGQTIEDFGEFYNCYSHLITLVYNKQYAKYRQDMKAIEECLM